MNALRPAALLLSALAFSTLVTSPAAASCATDSPVPSRNAFLGTVIETEEAGRVAEVVTDDGERVTVLGTEDISWFSNSYSSVDRRYAQGGRYEFHPLNGKTPYSDNACSATHQLSGPRISASPGTQSQQGVLPAWLPVDEQAGPLGYLVFFGPLAAGALVFCALVRGLIHRRRAPQIS